MGGDPVETAFSRVHFGVGVEEFDDPSGLLGRPEQEAVEPVPEAVDEAEAAALDEFARRHFPGL